MKNYIPKDSDLKQVVWNVRCIKTFIKQPATPFIKEVCFLRLDPAEAG